jgi:hypothetical protein
VQPVGGHEERGGLAVDEHMTAAVLHLTDCALDDLDARGCNGVRHRAVQRGAPDAAPVTVLERCVGRAAAAEVADAGQAVADGVDAHGGQVADRAGHQALPAGLVHGAGSGLADDDVETGADGVQGGRQTHRPSARDHQVNHASPPAEAMRARRSPPGSGP